MKRRSSLGHSGPARQSSRAVGADQRWIVGGIILCLVGVTVFWVRQVMWIPRPPTISSETLNASAQALLQARMEAVRAAPQSGAAWGHLGALLRSLEFTKEACYCLELAEQLDPREARWPHLLGLQLITEKPREAVVRFRRAAD